MSEEGYGLYGYDQVSWNSLQSKSLARNLAKVRQLWCGELPYYNVKTGDIVSYRNKKGVQTYDSAVIEATKDYVYVPIFEIKGKSIEEVADLEDAYYFQLLDFNYDQSIGGVSAIESDIFKILEKAQLCCYILCMGSTTRDKFTNKIKEYFSHGYSLLENGEIVFHRNQFFPIRIKISNHIRDNEVYAFSGVCGEMPERQNIRYLEPYYFEEIGIGILDHTDDMKNVIKYILK